jgi:carboxymethylenebutenolidase
MIDIETLDHGSSFKAYCSEPSATPKAAIIIVQEIFGVNAGIRDKADSLAAEGYLAIAPDLFWRIEPGIELDPDVAEQLQKGFDLFGKFDQLKGVEDIEATIKAARKLLGGSGKVGAVGYCLGGRLAYMTAARTDIDASVGYYGVGIDGLLNESHAIARPLLLHVPQGDHLVPPESQAAMHAGLDSHPKVTIEDYPGLDHGFATQFGARRDEQGARLADGRTAAFFAEHLA